MPTYLTTNGDEFIIKQEDRGYNGKLTEVFKADKNGVVTVAGQTISSSGVIGNTGAVTATTIAASGLVAAAAAVTVGTTLAVTGASTLTGNTGVTGTLTVTGATALNGGATSGGKTVATGSIFSIVATGRNLTGDIAMAGTVAGDQLVAAFNHTGGTNLQASFEQTVTITGHLQQSDNGNLSAQTILFLFHRP
jgi:hypothetical protein